MGRMLLVIAGLGTSLVLAASGAASPPPVPTQAVVVPTGRGPCGEAVQGGSLWVGVYETGRVLQIDGAGRVRKRFGVGRWACRVAVGPTALWVTRDRANEIVRVPRGSGRTLRVNVGATPFDVLLAAGSVWASSYETGTVARLDPRTGRSISISRDGPNPAGLASCGGHIWVGHGRRATWVTAIDPASPRVRRVDVGSETPSWPSCIHGELWVTTVDSVVRVDPRTGTVAARVRLGGTPADAVGAPDGLVWVTDKERSLVDRVDPQGTKLVDSFPAGPGAFAAARLGSTVWVTSYAGSDVRRYDP